MTAKAAAAAAAAASATVASAGSSFLSIIVAALPSEEMSAVAAFAREEIGKRFADYRGLPAGEYAVETPVLFTRGSMDAEEMKQLVELRTLLDERSKIMREDDDDESADGGERSKKRKAASDALDEVAGGKKHKPSSKKSAGSK